MEPDFDAVILYLKKALYINKAKFGENHPSVARMYHDLAVVYHKLVSNYEFLTPWTTGYLHQTFQMKK